MTKRWRSIVGAGVLALAASATAHAQTAPVSLSLDDARARGKATAPRLAEAAARQEVASAIVSSRQAMKRPSLTASAGYMRTNHVDEFGIPQAGGGVKVLFPDIPNN